MRNIVPILVMALSTPWMPAYACSCMGNNSYCESLSPTWWVNPDATALVVKLTDYHYGITVKVVEVIGDGSLPNDTLTVWRDHGALCRIYLNGIAIGDTMVFGLNETDFMGNYVTAGYPPDLERSGDYMVSGCGVYALNFNNGQVVGSITTSTAQSMSLDEFELEITSCELSNGVPAPVAPDPLIVLNVLGKPALEFRGRRAPMELTILDMQGRSVLRRRWDGSSLLLDGFSPGTYIAEVVIGTERWWRKVMME